MNWLFPSLVATFCSTLIFAFVYLILYHSERGVYFKYWTVSWFIYSLRFGLVIISLISGQSLILLIGSQLSTLFSAVLLLWGTLVWLHRSFSGYLAGLTALMAAWIIVVALYDSSFLLLTLPTFIFLGFLYVWTGVVFIRFFPVSSIGKYLTGWSFILWGIHKMDYPFLRPVVWFAPWGYLLGAMLTVLAAFGLVLTYFEKTKRELGDREVRFENIIRQTGAGYFQISKTGYYENVNQAWLDMHHFNSPDEVIGRHFLMTQVDQDMEKAQRNVDRLLSGAPIPAGEFSRRNADGSVGYHLFSAVPVVLNGVITGMEGFLIDLTDRKEAEERIAESLKEKKTLLQEIHHRVKNNMQIVASLLRLQANQTQDPHIKSALTQSQSRVYAMSTVHETLYHADDLSLINFRQYLQKLIGALSQSLAINSIAVAVDIRAEEIMLPMDKASPLGLTVNELVSNAYKHAFPDGEGQITVDMKHLDQSRIQVIVEDNGTGLPDGFDWAVSETLGLKLVRSLVEGQLDGSINVETVNGTRCVIEFKN